MWLDRFEWIGSQLMAIGIDGAGDQHLIQPDQMSNSMSASRKFKSITLNTSFDQMTRTSGREYAAAFGITSGVTTNHPVLSVSHEGREIVLPAWEMQRTLLGAPASFTNYVYRPAGLEQLCSPVCAPDEYTISWVPGRELGRQKQSRTLTERLMWFFAYPSAYRAWNSIYRHARNGRIDMDLPNANIRMSAYGKIIDNVLYARRVYVLQVTPTEPPLDWAKTNRLTYDFSDGLMKHLEAVRIDDSRLRKIGDRWNLTDDEWAVVDKIIFRRFYLGKGGRRIKFDARELVDRIVTKLGTRGSWMAIDNDEENFVVCREFYNRMKKDGRWNQIVEFLASSRRES
jgi:hypothetical protein